MKKLSFLAIIGLLLTLGSCSNNEKGSDVAGSELPLKAFAVQVGSSYYNAVIDQYQKRAEIGALEELSAITGVEYTLGSETATIWPDPQEFLGKWQKSQTVIVSDNGRETAYDIVFTLYEEEVPSTPEVPEEPAQKIIFFDDFSEGEIPNEEYWKLCTAANSAWNKYFDDEAGYRNVKIEDGVLVLTADNDGRYRNGGIRTKTGIPVNSMLEVRARFKKAGGGFPAIWQMPINGRAWPQSGEIDIMEWVQGNYNLLWHTIHTYGGASQNDKSTSRTSTMVNTDEYHIYGVSRTAKQVTFWIDGNKLWSYVNENKEGDEGYYQYPFAEHDYDIILNYSLGGSGTWPGVINDNDLPATMHVDWVRVTEYEEE